MRQLSLHIKTSAAARLGAITLALACPLAAVAQFSGPALTLGQQGNIVQVPTSDTRLLNPSLVDLNIVPGDLISVRVFGQPDYAPFARVSNEGTVQLPLIGTLDLKGLTPAQAENLIASKLVSGGFYLNPQVSVQVTETGGQFATVGGEIHAVVPLRGSQTLLEVLSAAGSLPADASRVITILRPGVAEPIVVDLGTDPARSGKANIPILPRDTILVSRVGVVYVVGAFTRQGSIALTQTSPLTLMQATALSGGIGFEGKFADMRIIRTVGLERKVVTVNIKKVLHGEAPDPVLQADDILFLPSDAIKAALKNGGIGTLEGIISLLIVSAHGY